MRGLAHHAVVLAVVLCASAVAWGNGIAAGPGGGVGEVTFVDGMPDGWKIGTDGTPVSVILDTGAGAWEKHLILLNYDGSENSATVKDLQYFLWEYIGVQGQLPWEDWHEEILTEGWEWGMTTVSVGPVGGPFQTAPGLVVTYSPDNKVVWFEFDPVAPGLMLEIVKELIPPGGTGSGEVVVLEYPTPEPATLAVLSVGGILLLRRRRR